MNPLDLVDDLERLSRTLDRATTGLGFPGPGWLRVNAGLRPPLHAALQGPVFDSDEDGLAEIAVAVQDPLEDTPCREA